VRGDQAHHVADPDPAGAENLGVDTGARLGSDVIQWTDPVVHGGYPQGGEIAWQVAVFQAG
jgi:hypothetical protein